MKLNELFTEEELKAAFDILRNGGNNATLVEKVVTPEVLTRINKKTGQENDARYMAYALEFGYSIAVKELPTLSRNVRRAIKKAQRNGH